jgi:hypothetical protein
MTMEITGVLAIAKFVFKTRINIVPITGWNSVLLLDYFPWVINLFKLVCHSGLQKLHVTVPLKSKDQLCLHTVHCPRQSVLEYEALVLSDVDDCHSSISVVSICSCSASFRACNIIGMKDFSCRVHHRAYSQLHRHLKTNLACLFCTRNFMYSQYSPRVFWKTTS